MILEQYADIYVKNLSDNRYAVYYCYNVHKTITEEYTEDGNIVQKEVYEAQQSFGQIVDTINEEELITDYKKLAELYKLEAVSEPKVIEE